MTYYVDILIQKAVETEEEWETLRNSILTEKNNHLDFWYKAGFSTSEFEYPSLEEENSLYYHRGK